MRNIFFNGLLSIVFTLILTGCPNATQNDAESEYTVRVGTLINANGNTLFILGDREKGGTRVSVDVSKKNGYRLKPGTLRFWAADYNGELFSDEKDSSFFNRFWFILPAEDVTITAEFEPVFVEEDIIGTWEGLFEPDYIFFDNHTFIEKSGDMFRKGTWVRTEALLGDFDLILTEIYQGKLDSDGAIESLTEINKDPELESLGMYASRCSLCFNSNSLLFIVRQGDDWVEGPHKRLNDQTDVSSWGH